MVCLPRIRKNQRLYFSTTNLMLSKILKPYFQIEKIVLQFIAAEFFIQLVNASFMMILNIYLSKKGYEET